jgi:4-hydroxy-3-methylbut-2-enyl diphosphate reductase
VIDAACPLVTKVHKEGQRYAAKGYEVILIGHAGHPEVEGTMGRIKGRVHLICEADEVASLEPADPEKLAFVTQTTLSVDDTRDVINALRVRFPGIVGPDTRDICYATQNRQTAVRALARAVDVILVVGAQNSSNSNRLREIGVASGRPSYLINSAETLDLAWLEGARAVGITAGASAPELLVQQLVERLAANFDVSVETLAGIEENVHFRLPSGLAESAAGAPAE